MLGTHLNELWAVANTVDRDWCHDKQSTTNVHLRWWGRCVASPYPFPPDLWKTDRFWTQDRQFEIVSTHKSLTKRAQFTNSWKREYLMSLGEASAFLHRPSKDIIQVGDIVLLRNEGKPHAFWKLAKVTELVRGRDGAVSSAKILCLTSSKEKTTELRRPVQHLVPLELRTCNDNCLTLCQDWLIFILIIFSLSIPGVSRSWIDCVTFHFFQIICDVSFKSGVNNPLVFFLQCVKVLDTNL